jgi:hypothetical protein
MARKVNVQKMQSSAGPSQPVDPKAQDYVGMWAIFMVVLGVCMVARLAPWMGAVAGAVLGGGLGQVLPVRDDGKRIPMPVAAGLIIVGLVLILIGAMVKK